MTDITKATEDLKKNIFTREQQVRLEKYMDKAKASAEKVERAYRSNRRYVAR